MPVQLRRRAGSDPGAGAGQPREAFPTVAAVPSPPSAAGSRAGVPEEGDSRGRGSGGKDSSGGGGIQARRAGFDEIKVGFPTVAPPARTAAALRAQR